MGDYIENKQMSELRQMFAKDFEEYKFYREQVTLWRHRSASSPAGHSAPPPSHAAATEAEARLKVVSAAIAGLERGRETLNVELRQLGRQMDSLLFGTGEKGAGYKLKAGESPEQALAHLREQWNLKNTSSSKIGANIEAQKRKLREIEQEISQIGLARESHADAQGSATAASDSLANCERGRQEARRRLWVIDLSADRLIRRVQKSVTAYRIALGRHETALAGLKLRKDIREPQLHREVQIAHEQVQAIYKDRMVDLVVEHVASAIIDLFTAGATKWGQGAKLIGKKLATEFAQNYAIDTLGKLDGVEPGEAGGLSTGGVSRDEVFRRPVVHEAVFEYVNSPAYLEMFTNEVTREMNSARSGGLAELTGKDSSVLRDAILTEYRVNGEFAFWDEVIAIEEGIVTEGVRQLAWRTKELVLAEADFAEIERMFKQWQGMGGG